ncbi:hypothetical protein TNCV_3588681 [Trichonephila clavipes]|nr:hypothetical protein TNCV_3588681 [Trichonephila clavipes]
MSDISDISDFMDFSPTRQSKVAACEKLRDTVHSISAMHSSISEGARTPTKKNSFLELYQMTSYDLAKKKDELVPFPHVQEMIAKSIKFPRLLRILTLVNPLWIKLIIMSRRKNKIKSVKIELRNPRRNLFFRKRRLGSSPPFLPRTR